MGIPASGPGVAAVGDLGVDGVGLVEGPVPIQGDEGVVGRVEPLDPGESGLGQLPGADLFGPDRTGQVGDRGGAEVDVCHSAVPPIVL